MFVANIFESLLNWFELSRTGFVGHPHPQRRLPVTPHTDRFNRILEWTRNVCGIQCATETQWIAYPGQVCRWRLSVQPRTIAMPMIWTLKIINNVFRHRWTKSFRCTTWLANRLVGFLGRFRSVSLCASEFAGVEWTNCKAQPQGQNLSTLGQHCWQACRF